MYLLRREIGWVYYLITTYHRASSSAVLASCFLTSTRAPCPPQTCCIAETLWETTINTINLASRTPPALRKPSRTVITLNIRIPTFTLEATLHQLRNDGHSPWPLAPHTPPELRKPSFASNSIDVEYSAHRNVRSGCRFLPNTLAPCPPLASCIAENPSYMYKYCCT